MELCGVCKHYHKYEQGEICEICGHHPIVPTTTTTVEIANMQELLDLNLENPLLDASEILPNFIFLGSYNDAHNLTGTYDPNFSKATGASHILNAVPGWTYPFGLTDRFTCHFLQKGKFFPFDDAIQFLDQCEKDKVRVFVFCMTGNSRSPAIVIAYLMKCKGWRLGESYQWVKERRTSIDLSPDMNQQLKEYEQKIFGADESSRVPMNDDGGLGFPENDDADHVVALSKLNIESSSDNAVAPSCSEPPVAQPRERKVLLFCKVHASRDPTIRGKGPARQVYFYKGRLCSLPEKYSDPVNMADLYAMYPPGPEIVMPKRRKWKIV